MRNAILWALVLGNAVLAVMLVARATGDNAAVAQAARRPSEYLMIAGEITGGNTSVVYMVDTTNGMLGAMAYDDPSRTLNTMPPIELARVFEGGAAAGGAGGVGGRARPR